MSAHEGIPNERETKTLKVYALRHYPIRTSTQIYRSSTHLYRLTHSQKGKENRRFFNVLPKRVHQKNERVCSCTTTVYVNLSMNSFMSLTGNFIPESGCKITHFFISRKTTRKKIFILIYYLTFVNALRV